MNGTYRVCITWIGSIEGRVYSGINYVSPDEVYFLIEDKQSPQWKEFHEESLKNIIKCFGKQFENENKGHKEIIDLKNVKPEEQYKLIFNQIYKIISNTRKKYPDAAITIDTSAAPKPILFVLTFVATTLSTDRSPIILQSTQKKLKSTPDYYASDDSEYFDKYIKNKEDEHLSLYEFRRLEKLDPGGDIIPIQLPRSDFEILNPEKIDDYRLLALFSVIPSYENEQLSSNEIGWKVFEENPNLFKNFVQPSPPEKEKQNNKEEIKRVKKENKCLFSWSKIPGKDTGKLKDFLKQSFDIDWGETLKIEKIDSGKTIRFYKENNSISLILNKEKNKATLIIDDGRTDDFIVEMENDELNVYKKDKDESRAFKIMVGKKLEKLKEKGLINIQKPGKIEYAKKTWGGDLISGVTDELHEKSKSKIFS